MKFLSCVIACLLLAACVSKEHRPYYALPSAYGDANNERAHVTLERTACHGFCPIYKVRVDDRDILVFAGERFVTEAGGAISKRLPDGSFDTLVKIAKDYDFASFDAAYPNAEGSNCPSFATDMPSIIISYDAGKLNHSVTLDQGCFGFAGREKFDEMVAKIDAVLALDDWIGEREAFYGAKE